jgi:phosphoesterase RecJ-like protein
MLDKIKQLVADSTHVVVVQADNPDADSLGSALALEHILGDLGKTVTLYCGVDTPGYLRYLSGWDRVVKDLPKQFDLSIIVDASTYTLLEQLDKTGQLPWLKTKPCVVIDHHANVDKKVEFATASLIEGAISSTGEVLYGLATDAGWVINKEASEFLMNSILGDTQGLTNELTSAETYRVMAALTDLGADRPKLEERRREMSKMAPAIYKYKGRLISRTELSGNDAIAHVTVPQVEINQFSPLYNPAALVQFDMLQIEGVKLSIVFKDYDDGHVTGAIRSSVPIAGKLAEHMGGGGHDYASGFKIVSKRSFEDIRDDCLNFATELLAKLN